MTAVRHRNWLIWFILALVTVVLIGWWWRFVIATGNVAPPAAAFVPLALPVLLVVRGAISRSGVAPVVSGVVLGLSLFGASGRGAVFLTIGFASVLVELAVAGDARRGRGLAWLVGGFGVGLVVLALLPA